MATWTYTPSNRLLIEDRCKIVLDGAGKHGGAIHQRKSSPMAAAPRRLHLGSVEFAVRLAAEAFRRGRVRRLTNALENAPFRRNHRCHFAIVVDANSAPRLSNVAWLRGRPQTRIGRPRRRFRYAEMITTITMASSATTSA